MAKRKRPSFLRPCCPSVHNDRRPIPAGQCCNGHANRCRCCPAPESFQITVPQSAQACLFVDQNVALTLAHPFLVTAPRPLLRVAHHSGSNHVQFDIDHAIPKMLPGLNHGTMITVFPTPKIRGLNDIKVLLSCDLSWSDPDPTAGKSIAGPSDIALRAATLAELFPRVPRKIVRVDEAKCHRARPTRLVNNEKLPQAAPSL